MQDVDINKLYSYLLYEINGENTSVNRLIYMVSYRYKKIFTDEMVDFKSCNNVLIDYDLISNRKAGNKVVFFLSKSHFFVKWELIKILI